MQTVCVHVNTSVFPLSQRMDTQVFKLNLGSISDSVRPKNKPSSAFTIKKDR